MAAELRQVLAAHALRGCEHVIEIGGAGLPITGFLTHRPASVTVIDPKIPAFADETLNGAPCRVRHVAAKLQQVDLAPSAGRLGLVLLGLSLKPYGSAPALGDELLALARRAEVLVIDYALTLERALGQIAPLLAVRDEPATIDVELKLNDPALAEAGFDRRRFLVFDRG
ncbi:MAG TPA: hypothetical protein VGO06_05580 [Bosea sp. (in: a-proteobacteria)]|jgi:hypothetical protein|uniref:hypothetical protein n=1 Tax=Bosea sp. (in: a-proteobacteria) TaxID=1871050 RepID=UPI002E1030CB|nr:hypothetical protein [Bosea sp. (in: a-proteobacteria)]